MAKVLKMRFGLKSATIMAINGVLAQYPQIEQAIIYGSRAKGNYRIGSDIDLTLVSDELTPQHLNRIATQLDDLLLPYSIDLSLFKQIDNADLVDHIKRVGKVFYQKTIANAA